MKRLFLSAAIALAAMAPPLHAQFLGVPTITFDPTQAAHVVHEIAQAEKTYTTVYQTTENVISAYNLAYPTGVARIDTQEYPVTLNNTPLTPDSFNNIPIKVVGGATIYMRDVAQVRDGSTTQTTIVRRNGARGALEHIAQIVADRAVVGGVRLRPQRVQTDAHRVEPGIDQLAAADWIVAPARC